MSDILVEPIFSTLINSIQLDEYSIKTFDQYIDNITDDEFTKTNQTKNTFILDLQYLKSIKIKLENILNVIGQQVYNIDTNINKISITQSWINKNDNGVGHDRHMHPNSFLSGIVLLSQDVVAPVFYSIHNKLLFGISTPNMTLIDKWSPDVVKGKLVVFPSGLEHDVPSNTNKNPRYTLSFNTSVSGPYGSIDELTYRG